MTEQQPIDLRALDTAEPDVLKDAIRRFRRRMLARAVWVLVFAMAVVSIGAGLLHGQNHDFAARIGDGAYYNGVEGDYRVGGVDIGLVKVTALSGDRWGLEFILHRNAPFTGGCCSVSPAAGLGAAVTYDSSAPAPRFIQEFVALPRSAGPSFAMTLTDESGIVGGFTVDLVALQVAYAGGNR